MIVLTELNLRFLAESFATEERKQLDVDFAKNVLWEMITEGCAEAPSWLETQFYKRLQMTLHFSLEKSEGERKELR